MTAPVMVRGSMRCPVPGCGGMLRPETNGMGRLIEICDYCVTRTQEHARLGHYFRSLERRIAALESRESVAAAAPVAVAKPSPATIDLRPSMQRVILEEVAALAPNDVLISEITPRVMSREPRTTAKSISTLVHSLVKAGRLVATGRHAKARGAPQYYALPSSAPTAPLAEGETTDWGGVGAAYDSLLTGVAWLGRPITENDAPAPSLTMSIPLPPEMSRRDMEYAIGMHDARTPQPTESPEVVE